MAVIKTKRASGQQGFTLIDLLFVIALLGLVSTLAMPGLMRARVSAQSASALGTIKVVNSAQLSYAITCGLGFYAPTFPNLGAIPPGGTDGFISGELSSGPTFIKSGYLFSMAGVARAGTPASCNGVAAGQASAGYAVIADPLDTTPPGKYFGSNSDGGVWQDTASFSATMPESGAPPQGAPIGK